MVNTPQIPQSQQSILQSEDKKVDRIWYNFFQGIVQKLTQLDGGTP